MLNEVASIVGKWVSDKDSGLKSNEKTNFVQRMMTFEHVLRNTEPYKIFLQMIYDLISNPSPPEPDLIQKVQRACMIGLRCRDPAMRQNFFTHFEGQIQRTLGHRLAHIIQKQEWDAIGDSYWLKHAVELILCISNQSIKLGEGQASTCEADGKDAGLGAPILSVLADNDTFLTAAFDTTTGTLQILDPNALDPRP